MEVRFYLPLKPRAPIRATLSTPPPSRLNSPSLSPIPVLLRFAIHRTPSSSSLPLCLRAFHPLSLLFPSLLCSLSLFNPLRFCSTFSRPSSALAFFSSFPLLLSLFLFFSCSSLVFFLFPLFEFPGYGIKWKFLVSMVLVDWFFKYTIIDPLTRALIRTSIFRSEFIYIYIYSVLINPFEDSSN